MDGRLASVTDEREREGGREGDCGGRKEPHLHDRLFALQK